jgi:hypothetical protein
MSGAFAVAGWMIIVGVVFVPALVIATIILRSFGRALLLASAFTAGALPGFIIAGAVGWTLIRATSFGTGREILATTLATLGAIAGGAIAVWLCSRCTGSPPWRRL